MTATEFNAKLRALGLTPMRPKFNKSTLYRDAAGEIYSIPDPETLDEVERADFLKLFMNRTGFGI